MSTHTTDQSHDLPGAHDDEEEQTKCHISKVAPDIVECTVQHEHY